jgi:hypothetical protein
MLAHLATNIGRIPDERLLAPQIFSRALSGPRYHRPLILPRRELHLATNCVERYHGPIRRIRCNPMIFAGPRQSRHHDHLAVGVVKRQVIRITVFFAKVQKSAVIARELTRGAQAPLFEGVLGEESDVVEQFPLVIANSTSRIGLGAKRQQITARGVAARELSPARSILPATDRPLRRFCRGRKQRQAQRNTARYLQC